MAYLVLDSSVIVAALVENEQKHLQCMRLLEKIKNGDGEFLAIPLVRQPSEQWAVSLSIQCLVCIVHLLMYLSFHYTTPVNPFF